MTEDEVNSRTLRWFRRELDDIEMSIERAPRHGLTINALLWNVLERLYRKVEFRNLIVEHILSYSRPKPTPTRVKTLAELSGVTMRKARPKRIK